MKTVNNRRCILTKQSKPKADLIRIVKQKNGVYLVNSDAPGRGAYISRHNIDPALVMKRRVLNRAFRAPVPTEVYHKLLELLNKGVDDEK